MTAYYNENDKYAAAWLRNLIAEGLIAKGDVDERDIREVKPADVAGYTQCHFFAGIGGWSYALRLAGWQDDRPVWTGSCPCQPFSVAGQRKGEADARHLWPDFARLISVGKPSIVFGEQVASKAGREWFANVRTDMEGMAYACAAADLCAPSVGAPHIRQRLYWVADSVPAGRAKRRSEPGFGPVARSGSTSRMAYANEDGSRGNPCGLHSPQTQSTRKQQRVRDYRSSTGDEISIVGVCHPDGAREYERTPSRKQPIRDERDASFWSGAELIHCRDGKYRPVEPGTFPLAHGIPARMGRLRGYGNAIVPQVAAQFISAYMEIT